MITKNKKLSDCPENVWHGFFRRECRPPKEYLDPDLDSAPDSNLDPESRHHAQGPTLGPDHCNVKLSIFVLWISGEKYRVNIVKHLTKYWGSSTQDDPCRSNIGGSRLLQPLQRWRLCSVQTTSLYARSVMMWSWSGHGGRDAPTVRRAETYNCSPIIITYNCKDNQ